MSAKTVIVLWDGSPYLDSAKTTEYWDIIEPRWPFPSMVSTPDLKNVFYENKPKGNKTF